MATKYVRETNAGKSISAYVILKGSKEVATVQAYFGDGGRVLVNVFQSDKAAERSTKAARCLPGQMSFQHSSASGGGYDKFTAALSRLTIDGHRISDHCGVRLPYPKGSDHFPEGFKAPKGYRLANWRRDGGGYGDCYRLDGLKFLADVGYTVIQAV